MQISMNRTMRIFPFKRSQNALFDQEGIHSVVRFVTLCICKKNFRRKTLLRFRISATLHLYKSSLLHSMVLKNTLIL